MDPASAILLFVLFRASEKAIGYAGGKIADAIGKPIWDALEEKAKWIAGASETTKRWNAFSAAFADAKARLEEESRHPEVAKRVASILEQFDTTDPSDKDWLSELSLQLEKASLVSEKPDEYVLTEMFAKALSKQGTTCSRVELSETVSDFIRIFQDVLFAEAAYQELMLKRAWWDRLRQPNYDTRDRYVAQVIAYNEELDFVGIPELKDRQALRIEDVFIHLQTQTQTADSQRLQEAADAVVKRDALGLLQAQERTIEKNMSANEALAVGQKMVILGDPGAGKTTLLKFIVLAFAENRSDRLGLHESRLPIFIRLYDYVAKREQCGTHGFSFADYLNKFCTDNLQLRLAPDFFEQALERGECCVCLDGLDELGSAGLRSEITAAVSALAHRFPRNRFIVTSRIVGYEEAPLGRDEFAHHSILPLSDEDIQAFVAKWYNTREKDPVQRRERTEHLIKTIMESARIKALAANPLTLTIIALVHRIEAELPHERVRLYDKCVTTLTETWDKVRGLKTALRRRLLEKVAYWMHTQPGEAGQRREVREGNLRTQLVELLRSDPKLQLDDDQIQREVDEFIRLVKSRSGLLVERGEGLYSFSHLTFQEYLAACDIEKRLGHSTDAIWKAIQPHLQEAHWHEVILLLLGSLNQFEQHNSVLVRRIYESADAYEPVLHRYLLLAAGALSDHVEVDSALRRRVIDDLLGLGVSQEFAADEAFSTLGSLQGDAYVLTLLLQVAQDEKNTAVRLSAVQALGKLGHAEQTVPILLALAQDEKTHAAVRRSAVQALGKLGHAEQTVPILLALAQDEKTNPDLRLSAAQALGQLGHAEQAVPILLAWAQDEKTNPDLRLSAAQALGQLGHAEQAVPILLAWAQDEKTNAAVRLSAAQALGQLGRAEEAVPILLALAQDEKTNAAVRLSAAQALGQLGRAEEAIPILLALAQDEKNTAVRLSAVQALGKLGHAEQTVPILLALAQDEKTHAAVRRSAVQALGKLGHAEQAVPILLALAQDEKTNPDLRLSAAQALGQLGHAEQAVPILLALAQDEKTNAYLRISAAQALGQLGHAEQAVPILLAWAQDEKTNPDLRLSAAQALGQLGHAEQAVPILLALAQEEKTNAYLRISAAQALGQLGHAEEAVSILLAWAHDKKADEFDRYFAALALEQLIHV